ncbi:hypothetical protein EXU57_20785 [Segetibacter sp. 3557_3]|uniref:PID-CTERM protein-sorting domain-containing protein n=1 Tax=Segetibacter sp. 3557_3 TaxID=2547429 RepID=UPI0010591438|nr:hypothetical protein [Segetibacter sp. 3557_3]TDH20833.1 hypothetical protein EXU57_20785 [Segetibacter sp. 3557_3]
MISLRFLGKVVVCSCLLAAYNNTATAQCNKEKIPVQSNAHGKNIPNSVPFDGGATALLIAGGVYAIKKLYNKPNQSK